MSRPASAGAALLNVQNLLISDEEKKDVRSGLQQPLLVQAPLQGLLDTLFERLEAQAAAIAKLAKHAQITAEEETSDRVSLLEERFSTVFGAPGSAMATVMNPAAVQMLMDRVERLEALEARLEERATEAQHEIREVLHPRTAVLEGKLVGVDNLAGRLAAQDAIAEQLGVAVPVLRLSQPPAMAANSPASLLSQLPAAAPLRGSSGAAARTVTTRDAGAGSSGGGGEEEAAEQGQGRSCRGDMGSAVYSPRDVGEAEDALAAAAALCRQQTMRDGVITRILGRLEGLRDEQDDAAMHVETLQRDLKDQRLVQNEHLALANGRITDVEEAQQAFQTDAEAQFVKLTAGQQAMEALDVRQLRGAVDAQRRLLDQVDVALSKLQKQEVPELWERVEGLSTTADAVTDVNARIAELANAICGLERDQEVVKSRLAGGVVAALGADAAALSGAARQSDLVAALSALDSKVDRAELERLLKKAAAMALEALQTQNAAMEAARDLAMAPRAVKASCLACDRDVQFERPRSVGPLPSAAGLLPNSERFVRSARPSTAGATPIGPGLNAAVLRQQQLDESRRAGTPDDAGRHTAANHNRTPASKLAQESAPRTPVFT